MSDNIASPFLNIQINGPLIDDALNIHLSGFAPGQRLTLKATMLDDFARQWTAFAEFQADEQGCVDVATQAPLTGSYNDVDAMGLVWSMTPTGENKHLLFAKVQATLIPLSLTVEVAGETVTRVDMDRKLATPDIVRMPVRDAGLYGTFFYPASGEHEHVPAILLLGGSRGGLNESKAALLASHGYAVLSLAYFNYEQLPRYLVNIPLEYFATALDWLQAQLSVSSDRLGVIGESKGGELALLLGTIFPQIKAVVAYVPSGVVWQGFGSSYEEMMSNPSSWSYHGQPLPCVPFAAPSDTQSMVQPPTDKPTSFTSIYLMGLQNTEAVEKAVIQVEKTQGPILLISAQDDMLWPSTLFCEMVMQRLEQRKFPFMYQHLSYQGAGHMINYPYLPTTTTDALQSNSGYTLAFGGNAKDNAFAAADSWGKVLAFLEQHLRV